MTVPSPFGPSFPEQDYVMIEGERSPGQVRVLTPNSPRPWDVRKGYGMSWATVVPAGDDLSKFGLRFEFWDLDDVQPWYTYAAKYFDKAVRLTPGSLSPKALGIDHPRLKAAPFRITQCVIEDCIDNDVDEYGLWTIDVKCLQYRKPVAALGKPSAAIPAASTSAPTAKDAAQRQIQANAARIAALRGSP